MIVPLGVELVAVVETARKAEAISISPASSYFRKRRTFPSAGKMRKRAESQIDTLLLMVAIAGTHQMP